MAEYEKMLDRIYSRLTKTQDIKRRFEVPQLEHLTVGNRTFIKNFKQIATALARDEKHLLKFITTHLATAASIEGEQAIFQGKFSRSVIDRTLNDYIKEYIMCSVCNSPDTRLVKEDRFRFIICEACGAKSSVRSI